MICNNFYSGFCFKNECEIFKDYLEIGDFIISGFSYGHLHFFKQKMRNLKECNLCFLKKMKMLISKIS